MTMNTKNTRLYDDEYQEHTIVWRWIPKAHDCMTMNTKNNRRRLQMSVMLEDHEY
jgi:hypothetical protein